MDLTRYDKLRSAIRRTLSPDEAAAADRALEYAAEHTASQVRHDGSPMLDHAAEVARIGLEEIGLGGDSVVAAILHDVVRTASRQDEETFLRLTDEIRDRFGKEVLGMTVSLSHISDIRLKASREAFRRISEMWLRLTVMPSTSLPKRSRISSVSRRNVSSSCRLAVRTTSWRMAATTESPPSPISSSPIRATSAAWSSIGEPSCRTCEAVCSAAYSRARSAAAASSGESVRRIALRSLS